MSLSKEEMVPLYNLHFKFSEEFRRKKANENIKAWSQNQKLMKEELENAAVKEGLQHKEVLWPWPVLSKKSDDQNEDNVDMEADKVDGDGDATTDEKDSNSLKAKDDRKFAFIKDLRGIKIGSCPITTIGHVSPIPHMTCWAPTHRNQAISDCEVKTDIHIPYFGEETFERDKDLIKCLEKDSANAVKAVKREARTAADDEVDDFIFYNTVKTLMEDEKKNQNDVPDFKSGTGGSSPKLGPTVATDGSNEVLEMPSERLLQKLAYAFDGITSAAELRAKFAKISHEMNPTQSSELVFENASAWNIDGEYHVKQRRNKTMDTFHRTFCRRCFTYNCQTHLESIEHVFPEYRRKIGPFMVPTGPCSPNCWMNSSGTNSSRVSSLEWTAGDTNLYIVLANVYPGNFCAIGKIMGKPCAFVKINGLEESKNMPPNEVIADETLAELEKVVQEPVQTTSKAIVPQKGGKKKGNPLKRLRPVRPISPNARYTPCFHPGQPCDPTNMECSCKESNTYCEKYCNCEPLCKNRFQGCWCQTTCTTGVCPCFAAGRECDPDLCNGPDNKNHTNSCRNNVIQKGKRKHLLLAKSDIPNAGWGVFTKDPIAKGEFIYEYAGELISYAEAERRAIAYDKRCHTYLFELNDHFMVDAMVKGNKMRFANHSDNPNCLVKIIMVSGDHRIGVYAKRAIEPEEELFLYYKSVLMTHKEEQEKRAKVRKRTPRKTCKTTKEKDK